MVSAEYRLRKKSDIAFVYNKGRKAYRTLAGIVYCPGQTKTARITVVVSQRVSKHAVDRNRVKRRIRAALASKLNNIIAPYDIIVNAQPKALNASQHDLAKELEDLFIRAKLYAGN